MIAETDSRIVQKIQKFEKRRNENYIHILRGIIILVSQYFEHIFGCVIPSHDGNIN